MRANPELSFLMLHYISQYSANYASNNLNLFLLIVSYMQPIRAPTIAGTTQPSSSLVNGRSLMKSNGRPNPCKTESKLVKNTV